MNTIIKKQKHLYPKIIDTKHNSFIIIINKQQNKN